MVHGLAVVGGLGPSDLTRLGLRVTIAVLRNLAIEYAILPELHVLLLDGISLLCNLTVLHPRSLQIGSSGAAGSEVGVLILRILPGISILWGEIQLLLKLLFEIKDVIASIGISLVIFCGAPTVSGLHHTGTIYGRLSRVLIALIKSMRGLADVSLILSSRRVSELSLLGEHAHELGDGRVRHGRHGALIEILELRLV